MEVYLQYQRVCLAAQVSKEQYGENSLGATAVIRSASGLEPIDAAISGQPSVTESTEADDDTTILVGWDGPDDPLNPVNQSKKRKCFMTVLVSLIALAVTAASAIDACGVRQYSEYFGIYQTVGSLATGLFLIGFAGGSLLSGPFSETFGRSAIYSSTMLLYLIFIMASGLAPSLPSHLVFRLLAGFFASTPLSCAGGTVADLWDPLDKTWAFPLYAIPAFTGPMVGQIMGSYIPTSLGWRWLEWSMLIMGGVVWVAVLLFQPETYGDTILYWKAAALRRKTGSERYRAPIELKRESLARCLKLAIYRPFVMFYHEVILILISLYLTIIYIVLFTFLEGYNHVFGKTYNLSEGLTSVCWAGMLVGSLLVIVLVPIVYLWTAKAYLRDVACNIAPETRLWYSMLGGAVAVPVSLFWMGWTSHSNISIWSPLLASVVFGFGITTIFISSHMYLIDTYETYSASALSFLVFTRYLVAGGVTIAGGPIYQSIGVPYTLTILGSISVVMAFVPYLLYIYGPKIRRNSRFAVHCNAQRWNY